MVTEASIGIDITADQLGHGDIRGVPIGSQHDLIALSIHPGPLVVLAF